MDKLGPRKALETQLLPDDCKYVGEWKTDSAAGEGLRQGKGMLMWPDGAVYQGYFFKNGRHGFGRMIYPQEKWYQGEWYLNLKDG